MTTIEPLSQKPSPSAPSRLAAALAWACLLAVPAVFAQAVPTGGAVFCGEIAVPGQYGPFDYRTIPHENKFLVEMAHFTPSVETLQKGNAGSIGADLDYTLRAIPNHPRALLSLSRYSIRLKTDRVKDSRWTTDCYFDRAFRMAPDDPMPHVLFANYLSKRGRAAEAKREVDQASTLRANPSSADLDYNIGLVYYDLGEYEKAAVAANRAYKLGAPLPALRTKLKAKGKQIED